jgi:nicotinamidase/pyrazinamidase
MKIDSPSAPAANSLSTPHPRRWFLRSLAAMGLAGSPGWSHSSPTLRPSSNSALLVVDVQHCFLSKGSLAVAGGETIIPVINRLEPLFENIVVTQDWHPAGHASFASAHAGSQPFESIELAYGKQVLWPDHCVQGTHDAQLHEDVHLSRAQLIIRKGFHQGVDSYSAFVEADGTTSTGLAGYLNQRGIGQLFITGLATDFCVAWSAVDARKAGFEVYVIEDATRAIDLHGSLAAAWEMMHKHGVKRIRSSDLI